MSTWVVRQTLNLTHKSFCHFFVLSPRPHVASLDTPLRAIRHSILNTLFTPIKSLLGVKKWNLKFGSFTPPKWKIGTLSCRLVESCSRPISGTKFISTSNLEQVSTAEVASGNMAPRSKGHVTYSIKSAITQCWVVISSSFLGADMRTTPNWGHKMVAMTTPVAMATGPRSLLFMAAYCKNPKVYKVQNWHISSSRGHGH